MNLSLSPEMQRKIEERVKSGRYARAEDVLTAALSSLDQHERRLQMTPSELEALYPGLRKKLIEGLMAADQGKLSDGEEFFDQLDQEDTVEKSNKRRTA